MANRARKLTELPVANTIASGDLLLIEKVSGNNSVTSIISAQALRKALVRGPYTNDAAANTAGVTVGELYYDTSGTVKVRLS